MEIRYNKNFILSVIALCSYIGSHIVLVISFLIIAL